MILTATTAGGTQLLSHTYSLVDRSGSGNFASQVDVPAGTTANYDIVGRAAPDMPWVNLKTGQTASFLETVAYVPYFGIRINSISGPGPVRFVISEN